MNRVTIIMGEEFQEFIVRDSYKVYKSVNQYPMELTEEFISNIPKDVAIGYTTHNKTLDAYTIYVRTLKGE